MNPRLIRQWLYTTLIMGFGPTRSHTKAATSAYLVDTPGCRIPNLDPFDPLIKKYVWELPQLDCSYSSRNHTIYPAKQLVASNLTSLYVDTSTLSDYNIIDDTSLKCCYQPFWRVDGDLGNYNMLVDDQSRYAENCISFDIHVNIITDFVKVKCRIRDKEMYTNFFAFTPFKKDVEKRCARADKKKKALRKKDKHSVSVLVIGLDAVSRLNFQRQMPKTVAFLQEMDAIEMLGYNKVADNTFPNLLPVLTGLSLEETEKSCWKSYKTSFDNCTFLWDSFSKAGYRTALAEDTPITATFNYMKTGFVLPPTDYYMRPFNKHYEQEFGHHKSQTGYLCIRSRMTFEVLLEYASKFTETMSSKKSFGFFWETSLTHDYLNYPQMGDEPLESWLREKFTNSTALKNTVVVLMSDHGLRYGDILKTHQGRLEERLPFLYFIFPTWFSDKYSSAVKNLKRNTRKLTTPFNLHHTLADLIDLSKISNPSIQSRKKYLESLKSNPRDFSLFLPVSKNRTCSEAGIASHWCTCQKSKPLDVDSPVVNAMAEFLVKHINHLLLLHSECSELHLVSVHDARVLQSPFERLRNVTLGTTVVDSKLVLETVPGHALFEATIRRTEEENYFHDFQVIGTISRINMYGNQSACIDDYRMKLYCYCHV